MTDWLGRGVKPSLGPGPHRSTGHSLRSAALLPTSPASQTNTQTHTHTQIKTTKQTRVQTKKSSERGAVRSRADPRRSAARLRQTAAISSGKLIVPQFSRWKDISKAFATLLQHGSLWNKNACMFDALVALLHNEIRFWESSTFLSCINDIIFLLFGFCGASWPCLTQFCCVKVSVVSWEEDDSLSMSSWKCHSVFNSSNLLNSFSISPLWFE